MCRDLTTPQSWEVFKQFEVDPAPLGYIVVVVVEKVPGKSLAGVYFMPASSV